MTARERLLLIIFGSILVPLLFGGGFFVFFLKPSGALQARMEAAQQDVERKSQELQEEKKKLEPLLALDPRLEHWKQYSLTDSPSRNTAEIESHKRAIRLDYERELSMFLTKDCGLTNPKITVKETETRSAVPQLGNKVPAYHRFQFNVEVAAAKYDAIVKMMEKFYRQERLQSIRDISIVRPKREGGFDRGDRGPPGGPPAAGQAPAAPAEAPAIPQRFLGGMQFQGMQFQPPQPAPPAEAPQTPQFPGRGDRGGRGGERSTSLTLKMTVEVLQVTGAETPEERKARLAKEKQDKGKSGSKDRKPPVSRTDIVETADGKLTSILAPGRKYSDMLERNIFFGNANAKLANVTESEQDVLSNVRLVMIERIGENWRPELRNLATGDYYHPKPESNVLNTFKVRDRYKNEVLEVKIVDANCNGVVFEVKNKFYRMRGGESLLQVLYPGKDEHDALHKPLTKYKPGDWTGIVSTDKPEAEAKTENEPKDKKK